MPISLIHPSRIRGVSDDFAAHVARGSVNPGTDYLCPVGTVVVAVKAGTITNAWTGFGGSGGRQVEIDHGDGDKTQYLHLDALTVTLGQQVAQGQQIGVSGSSANGKSRGGVGPHLHLALKRHGRNIDFAALILQQTLNTKTGTKLAEDGDKGPATIAATKAFQEDHKLVVDGDAGQATWGVLDALPIPGPVVTPAEYPAREQFGEDWVKTAQQKLLDLGFDIGRDGVDGKDGQATQAAVRALQTQGGLRATGLYDPETDAYANVLLTPEPQPVPDPVPEPTPKPEPPADEPKEDDHMAEIPTVEVPVKVRLDDERLAALLAISKPSEPSEPVIPDRVAKPLWVSLSLVAVSAAPVVALTVLDWSAWDAAVGGQFATTITAWAGSVAAVLGLSRYAKSK